MPEILRSARFATALGVVSLCVVLGLAGCGGGDDQTDPATQNALPGTIPNQAPTISGRPASTAAVQVRYQAVLTVADEDGDTLTLSAQNLPAWLTLDPQSGSLSGTPQSADIGTYTGILVTVSDGITSASLGPFSIEVTDSPSGSATLSWLPPTENTDGSALTSLTGYRILYGMDAADLSEAVELDNPSMTRYVIENLAAGTWYFGLVAVDGNGVESALSSLVSKIVG